MTAEPPASFSSNFKADDKPGGSGGGSGDNSKRGPTSKYTLRSRSEGGAKSQRPTGSGGSGARSLGRGSAPNDSDLSAPESSEIDCDPDDENSNEETASSFHTRITTWIHTILPGLDPQDHAEVTLPECCDIDEAPPSDDESGTAIGTVDEKEFYSAGKISNYAIDNMQV